MKWNMVVFFLCSAALSVQAQVRVPLTYPGYLERVYNYNLDYAAEKLNVDIAAAEIQAARVFNDPHLSVEYFNNQERELRMGNGVSVGLGKTISPGKRSAAIGLSYSEGQLTEALLADFFRNLRVEATLSYLGALKQCHLYKVKENAYENVRQLAEGDSVRLALGRISEVDVIQNKLDANILYSEMKQAAIELQNVLISLSLMTSCFHPDTLYVPECEWQKPVRRFELSVLLDSALTNRTDLVVALKNAEVAQKAVKVAKRERNMDIDLSVGVSRNARVRNEEAPAPPFTGVTAGIGIPLQFSNFNKGGIKAAELRYQQKEMQYRQARLQVQTEVMQAYRRFQLLEVQLSGYESGLLEQAGEVVQEKIDRYDRGKASLLEVLDAQRTHDNLRTSYIETLFDYSTALVELEKSAGIWDILL